MICKNKRGNNIYAATESHAWTSWNQKWQFIHASLQANKTAVECFHGDAEVFLFSTD